LVSQEFPPYTNWGGVGVQFDVLARGLARRGHAVTVVSRAAPRAPAYESREGVEIWRVGVPLWRKRLLGRTIDRLLHARAAAARVAALDSDTSFDVVEASVTSLDAATLIRDGRFAPRTVICVHGSNFKGQEVPGPLAALHRLDWQWSGRREVESLHRAPRIAVASEATRRLVLEHGVDARKIDLIPLGIDTDRFHPAEPSRRGGRLAVGFVGRLQQGKGIDFVWRVIDAIGLDAGVEFRFKGAIHPANRPEVIAQLARHSSIAIHEPAGSHDEMPAFFRTLDALLLPSRFENFGLTYAEAMASELLVLAGAGGAGRETVTDGETGFLVDPDGPVDRVVAVLRRLAADRSAYDGIRRRAREEVVRRMSNHSFVSGKEAQYRSVASGPARGAGATPVA
jgi:glycosyltransferase involved in cell wall biosynthesis